MEISISIADSLHRIYPDASVGVMVVEHTANPKNTPELDSVKEEIESNLRLKYPQKELLRNLPELQAYKAYYKQFKKSYHVLFQLESVIFNGRSIPNAIAVVQAMFMAELDNMLLTAGHDLDEVRMPVTIGLAHGDETYTLMNGNLQTTKANDMCMADQEGVISSVIYGPDQRTRIKSGTSKAMFVVYAPAGIEKDQVKDHLSDIQRYINLFSPEAVMTFLEIF